MSLSQRSADSGAHEASKGEAVQTNKNGYDDYETFKMGLKLNRMDAKPGPSALVC